jgi:bleomycin hydrolase
MHSGRLQRWVLVALLLAGATAYAEGLTRPAVPLKRVLTLSDAEKARLAPELKQQAIGKFGLRAVALSNDFVARHNPRYACVIPGEDGPHHVRDQKGSGRCWIYATDRVLRSMAARKGVAQPPPMSTSFVNYHALRMQTLGVLRAAAAGEKKALSPSAVGNASEGGYQPWALDIIRERGVVPRTVMDTSADGASSGLAVNELQRLVASAQREFAAISKQKAPDAAARRQSLLVRYERDVDALLGATIGAPPSSFRYRGKQYTPQSFLKDYLHLAPADLDFVVLSNDPTARFGRRHETTQRGMKPFGSYNVAMPVLERAVQDTIRRGDAVYVATNVSGDQPYRAAGKNIPRQAQGIVSLSAFNYGDFIPQRTLTKRDRLNADVSPTNHAMAITGFDPGKGGKGVRKWLVENSWGPTAGDAGHWHMYDDFFRQYVTEVAVPRSVVPASVLEQADARSVKKTKPAH